MKQLSRKDTILFAHANGFPANCYQQLLTGLSENFHVNSIDKLAHSDQFPVTENWTDLVDELIHHVEKTASRPVIALGHSLGGALSLLAAYRKPALFKHVVMLDMPIISPLKARALKWIKKAGLVDTVTPAKNTQHRRATWPSKSEARSYFRTRHLFKDFTEACLEDYLNYGLEKKDDAYHLIFDRHIEYAIYRTYPHVLPKIRPKVPTALIYGKQSNVVTAHDKKKHEASI